MVSAEAMIMMAPEMAARSGTSANSTYPVAEMKTMRV